MSILLNLHKLLTISFLYPMHNKVVCVWVYWFHSFCPSDCPCVHPTCHSALWLVAYFHKCYRSVYAPSMLVVVVRQNQRVNLKLPLFSWGQIPTMSDNFDALGTSVVERSLHMFDACSHFRANFDTHDICVHCAGLVQGINCVLQKTTVSHVHHGMISPGTCLKLTHWPLEDLNEIWMSNFQAKLSDW